MATKKESKPESPPTPENRTPVPELPVVVVPEVPKTGEVTTVTAASIVNEDKDTFPAGSNSNPPPVPEAFASAPGGGQTPQEPEKRGRGRPPGAKNKNSKTPTFEDLPPPKPPAPPVNYKALATMTFKISTSALAQFFGPEWLPRPPLPGLPGEEEMVIEATAKYMESKEMPDIPPGAMLCLVLLMYSAPRFQAPPTKAKIIGVWRWFASKFTRKKKSLNASPDARQPEKTEEKEKKIDPSIPVKAPTVGPDGFENPSNGQEFP